MNRKASPWIAAALLLGASAAAAAETAPEAAMVAVPETIVVRRVPPIPREKVEALRPYENIRSASFQDWHPAERRMLIGTRFGESSQLHEVERPLGVRRQLTFHREPASGGAYRPGRPEQIVLLRDAGGSENDQVFVLDRATGRERRLTDGVHRHLGALWSRDGKLLAYMGNARNGRDFDLYVADPDRPGSDRRVAELDGFWAPTDWSRDGKRLLLMQYVSANESHLHGLDLASGKVHRITPEAAAGEPTVSYGGGLWAADGRSLYSTSDRAGEFSRLVRIDLETGQEAPVSGDIPWDVTGYDLSDDGRLLAWFVSEDGISRMAIADTATGEKLPVPELPPGVAGGPWFRPGAPELAFLLNWARSPSDVYTYDPRARQMERWTESEVGGLDPGRFSVPELVRFPTFDTVDGRPRTIPAFVYRPDPQRFPGPRPVYLGLHGGPEGQALPLFVASMNFLTEELGVALAYPNVRGSTGYGKTYLKLDNGRLREDSVKDVGALLDWIATQPDLDASRVMASGGSYGGYMVLASLIHYGDRLRCGFDSVGISDFVTFLENTEEYRRDLRRVEYGDERDPEMRKFLKEISPASHVDRITRPLLVAQGANDPRVPQSESEQIVAALEARGIPVWYVLASDEGHGFRKKSNTDYLRAVFNEFLEDCLLGKE